MTLPIRKNYTGNGIQTTLSSPAATGSNSISVAASTNWPASAPFYIVVAPGTSKEEKMLVTAISGSSFDVTRGRDDTSAQSHDAGSVVYPVFTADEADEANLIASIMTTKGDLVTNNGTDITRLGVGTNTHVLQADSVSLNGMKWAQLATDGIADGAVTSAKILDGTIILSDLAASLQAFLLPTGTINIWPTATAPTGWLLCDGQSTTGYTSLAAVVGATVPDMRGRFPLGDDGSLTLGATGGSATILTANLPVHQHSVTSAVSVSSVFTGTAVGNHSHAKGTLTADSNTHNHATETTDSSGSHFHGAFTTTNAVSSHGHGTGGSFSAASGTSVSGSGTAYTLSDGVHTHTFDISTGGAHSHTISGSTADGGAHTPGGSIANTVSNPTVTSGGAGSGTAYYQPHLVINYIIKT